MKKKSKSYIVIDRMIPEGKLSERFVVCLSITLMLFISLIYFFWFGKGIFLYQENSSLFIYSFEYFHKFSVRPGGLIVYAGNFLTQLYFNPLYGTLIISSLLILFYLVLFKIFKLLSPERPFSLLFILIPSCSLLLLHTRYDLSLLHSLGYLLVVLFFLLSLLLAKRNIQFAVLCLFPIFFYLVGSFIIIYLGMYLIWSIFYEKRNTKYLYPAILMVIACITIIVFKELIFLQPIDFLLAYPLLFNETSLTIFLSLLGSYIIFFPLIISTTGAGIRNKKTVQIITLAAILTIFSLTVYVLFKKYDPVTDRLMQLEKSVYKQDWDEVIRQYERTPINNIIGQYYYNLALSEKGQLCSRLFFVKQNFGPTSLALPRDSKQAFRSVYFYYAIGLTGEAHHLAYELMVQYGYRPENIKMLIKTELIKGNYKIAERYINILKKTLHYKGWAERYEKMLYDPESINSDPELGEKIKMLPKRDFFILSDDAKNIELFLKINPDNKRAFEYNLARLLLEKDLVKVVSEVKEMKKIGYVNFPRHIEEAIVAFSELAKKVPLTGGLSVSIDTERRFAEYKRVFNSCRGNKTLIDKAMKKAEKDTFWYYLQY